MRRVLMIAFYVAPAAEVGGRRTDRFIQYLPSFGWEPIVLSVKTRYYNRCDSSLKIPSHIRIVRTLCPMPLLWYHNRKCEFVQSVVTFVGKRRRHWSSKEPAETQVGLPKYRFTLKSQLIRLLQLPDEHNGWIPFGVAVGYKIIRSLQPVLLYASAKPVSALVIGWLLKRLCRLPLVIDFRDIWVGNPWDDPEPSWAVRIKTWIEKQLVQDADLVVLNTEKALEVYRQRYYGVPSEHFVCIPNGYDLSQVTCDEHSQREVTDGPFTIVHTGTVYGRMDPRPFFIAIRNLIEEHLVERDQLRVHFYGNHDMRLNGESLEEVATSLGLDGIVGFHHLVARDEALRIQREADALLVLVPNTAVAVPSKIYEYLTTNKPILALCDENSATAQLIAETAAGVTANAHHVQSIQSALLEVMRLGKNLSPNKEAIERYNVIHHVELLSNLFGQVLSGGNR